MKRPLFALATLALLFACTPENINSVGSQNNPHELTVTGEALDVTDYTVTFTGYANLPLELGNAEVGIMYDINQSFESAKKVVATMLDENNMFSVTAIGLEPSTKYYYKSYILNKMNVAFGSVKSFTTTESNCPEGTVDLGMVLTRKDGTNYKLYWAKSNLCENGLCANPEDHGEYYAWGEINTKSNYILDTYYWYSHFLKEYFKYDAFGNMVSGFDVKTILEPEDDAAHVKLGGKWRMPTDEECTQLIKMCTWTNCIQNGVIGKKGTAPNGNIIFLPAPGVRQGEDLSGAGFYGAYWSSSLNTDHSDSAWTIHVDSNQTIRKDQKRADGASIRPVTE